MAEACYLYVYPSDAWGQTKVDGHHALRTVAAAGIDESGSEDDSPGAKHAHFGSGARGSSVLVDDEDLDRAPRLLSRKLVSVKAGSIVSTATREMAELLPMSRPKWV